MFAERILWRCVWHTASHIDYFSLPLLFITLCGVVCVQLVHFSLGGWKDIGHLIIIIKSEVLTLPIIFFHHILSLIAYTFREHRDFVLIIIAQFMMSANSRIRFGLQIVFVCLDITPSHYHHCANLSEDIEFIKCLSDIFCRVLE